MQTHREIAWEAWLHCYLDEKGWRAEDLGLSWSGFGGEDQLKQAFNRWYDISHPNPVNAVKPVISISEAVTFVEWLAKRVEFCPAFKMGHKPCRSGSPHDPSWCCATCRAYLIIHGQDPSKWPYSHWNEPNHQAG